MDKLVFVVPKRATRRDQSQVVRVDADFYALLQHIQAKTGLGIAKITAEIADYLRGNDAIEIKELEDE